MRIGIVATNMPHQVLHADALSEGLGRHGIESAIYPEGRTPSEEIVACWGWRLGEPLFQAGKRVLVMERGYIQRQRYASFGWNGLNGRAQRNWHKGNTRRLFGLFPSMLQAWNYDGSYALIVGQVSGDMSVRGVDLPGWYREAVIEAKRLGLAAKFRPHPVAVEYGEKDQVHGAEMLHGSLPDALSNAAVVFTYNSNAGVDAMLAGRPTVARDKGSMAWPVAAHEWRVQGEPDNRLEWASYLAWSQFSIEEIRSGFAWDVISDSQNLQ